MGRDEGLATIRQGNPVDEIESINVKYRMLKKICVLYAGVIFLIFLFAVLRIQYPLLEQTILREEVGVVAFVCFVSIQAIFEIETEDTVRKYPYQFYCKLLVYLIDACVLINARVKAGLVVFACVFAVVQLAYLYHGINLRFLTAKIQTVNLANPIRSKNEWSALGTGIIVANILALVLVLGKGIISKETGQDALKSVIMAGVVMFYFNTVINAKTDEFITSPKVPKEEYIIFHAFRIIRPVGSSILTKLKKLKKVKLRT